MKDKIIILENISEIDDPAFIQWVNHYADDNFENIVEKTNLLSYSEDDYKELFAEIAQVDAIAMHTSFNNFYQMEQFIKFLLSLEVIPEIYISYINYNKLTDFFNNELKGNGYDLRDLLKKLIEKHPNKIYEITYYQTTKDRKTKSYFTSEYYGFNNYELISSEELDYITHAFRRNKNYKSERERNNQLNSYKKRLKSELSENMEMWGYGEYNIQDLMEFIDTIK